MAQKILIIEDSALTTSLLRIRIESAGFDVITAQDGESGLEIMHAEIPDLVLLDVRMPGIDGFEVCKIAKNDPLLKNIPIIFVTTATQEKDIEKGKEAGADLYMTKPYDGNQLIGEIKKLLKNVNKG